MPPKQSQVDDYLHELPRGTVTTKFASPKGSREKIKAMRERSAVSQYLVVKQIARETFDTLSQQRDVIRFAFDYIPDLKLAIIRVKPGLKHNQVTPKLRSLIYTKVAQMGISLSDYIWLQDLDYQCKDRVKRPDECMFPSPIAKAGTSPRLVIEFSPSESAGMLMLDAQWWHTNSQAKVVIVVDVDEAHGVIRMELWHNVFQHPIQPTREFPEKGAKVSIPVREVRINAAGATGALRLCFVDLFKRYSKETETNILLTEAELNALWQAIQ